MTRSPLNLLFSKAIKPLLQDSVSVPRSGGPILLSPALWAHTLLKPKLAVTKIQSTLLSDVEASVFV